METDNQSTAVNKHAYVGAGVPTCPAEPSSANVERATHFGVIPDQASCARPPIRRSLGLRVIVLVIALALDAQAQGSGKTVRHHKVAVDDPSSPPELIQAESAIEKQDYSTAEHLLKKIVEQDPDNSAAWFDLGFLYNATGKPNNSIAPTRRSVTAKPEVFQSNLN